MPYFSIYFLYHYFLLFTSVYYRVKRVASPSCVEPDVGRDLRVRE